LQKLRASRTSCTSYEVIFDLEELQKELDKIEKTMAQADFWQKSQEEITRLSQQRVFLRGSIDQWNKYHHEVEDAKLLAEMALEEGDQLRSKTWSCSSSFPSRMIRETRSWRSTQGQEEPKPRIGPRCFSECITAGVSPNALKCP
jgi:hypothetical protein